MRGAVKRKVLFVLSVDTEEEFDWSGTFPQANCSIRNIDCLPGFQVFCEQLGIRPTYLVDYPVAADRIAAGIMQALARDGRAEIGAHLHPWCNPPIVGSNSDRESHVVNLPAELVRQKLAELTRVIKTNIGVTPKVFRTGRWGISSAVLRIVAEAGYHIDSSIYPYYANEYFSCERSCNTPYWPGWDNPDNPGEQRSIFEIPVTAGFSRPGFALWGRLHRLLSSKVLRLLKPVGLLWHTNIMRKLYLSPELTSADDMIKLMRAAVASGHPVLHMFLHSSSLLSGQNFYNPSGYTSSDMFNAIKTTLATMRDEVDIQCCTLSEAAEQLKGRFEGTQSRVHRAL